jgi:hypothetical protein
MLLTALFASALLLRADTWRVNPDGSAYISLANALTSRHGYTFPDGSFAGFRGPGYSGLLSLAFLIFEHTARAAMWASRAALVLNTLLVAAIAWTQTRRKTAAAVAGMIAAASPLAFETGASQFVPDGFAMTWVLLALLVVVTGSRRSARPMGWRPVLAGVLVGLAFLTKELSILALPIIWAAGTAKERTIGGLIAFSFVTAASTSLVVLGWLGVALAQSGHLSPPLSSIGGSQGFWLLAVLAAATCGASLLGLRAAKRRLRPLRVAWGWEAALLSLYFCATYAAVTIAAGPPIVSGREVPAALHRALLGELLGNNESLFFALLAAGSAILVVAVTRNRPADILVALAMGSYGLALLIYAVQRSFGVRNGAALTYVVALLAAYAVGSPLKHPTVSRTALKGTAAIAAVLLVVAGTARVIDSSDAGETSASLATWQGQVVDETSAWLLDKAKGSSVVGTFFFMTAIGGRVRDSVSITIAPMYGALPTGGRLEDLNFDRLAWWTSTLPAVGHIDSGRLIALTQSSRMIGAVFETDLLEDLKRVSARYLVVTGNLAPYHYLNTFDAGALVPYLDASGGFRRRFEIGTRSNRQWAIVYEIVSMDAAPAVPLVVTSAAEHLLDSSVAPRQVLTRDSLAKALASDG